VALVFAFGVLQRGRDLLLGQPRTVIAVDQERNAAAFVDVTCRAQIIASSCTLNSL
jgi:hypothetical protein